MFAIIGLSIKAQSQQVILSENFEGVLNPLITVQSNGTFNSYPGIENNSNFGSTKAFGFGLSTCPASCFSNYTSTLTITFPSPTFADSIKWSEMELLDNWGSEGAIYIDDIFLVGQRVPDSSMGALPPNSRTPDNLPRHQALKVNQCVTTIKFVVVDITNLSKITIDDLIITTSITPKGVGYWKNNPSAWPVQSLMLGTNSYTKPQLITILNTPVGSGNNADASLILAYQLIPAKLNIAAGAVAPASVTTAIANGDALIGSSIIPMRKKPNTPLGQQMVAVATVLENFNNGAMTTRCGALRLASNDDASDISSQFSLKQNFPNPFSETTVINYVLPEDSYVHLTVYNFIGETVATLAYGMQKAGIRSVEFNGSQLPSGIYFCRMQSGDFSATTKLLLAK